MLPFRPLKQGRHVAPKSRVLDCVLKGADVDGFVRRLQDREAMEHLIWDTLACAEAKRSEHVTHVWVAGELQVTEGKLRNTLFSRLDTKLHLWQNALGALAGP